MSSPMIVRLNCSILAYKTAEVDEWIKIAATLDTTPVLTPAMPPAITPAITQAITPNTAPNIRSVIISNGGLQLFQWINQKQSICRIAFGVKSANVVLGSTPKPENSSLYLECQGVEVISCFYESKHGNEAAGIAAAKLLPLSLLCQSMTALKLICRGNHIRSHIKSCPDKLNWAISTICTLLTQATPSTAPAPNDGSSLQNRNQIMIYKQEVKHFDREIADCAEKYASQVREVEAFAAKRKQELEDEHARRDAAIVEHYKPVAERVIAGLEATGERVDRKRVRGDFSLPLNEGFVLSEESIFPPT